MIQQRKFCFGGRQGDRLVQCCQIERAKFPQNIPKNFPKFFVKFPSKFPSYKLVLNWSQTGSRLIPSYFKAYLELVPFLNCIINIFLFKLYFVRP